MAELPTDSESEFSLPSVAELSGADSDGQPVVSWACGCRDGPCVTPGSPLHLHCEGLRASMQEQSSEAHRKEGVVDVARPQGCEGKEPRL